jgi:S1-C subfamily serine protease
VGAILAGGGVGAVALATRHDDTKPVSSNSGATVDRSTSAGAQAADAPVRVGPTGSVHDLVVAARPSIVAIHTKVTQTDVFGQQLQGEAAGSGFVLTKDGYIVTNNHVVDGATDITVALDDGSTETATLVGADPRSDLAVLHVDRIDLVPLPIGDSDAMQVGDPVVAIGNALDLGAEPTVTGGLVSAKDRTITEPNGQLLVNLIQTDAAISPGNSGGPLLDLSGNVVGINTAVAGQGQNIGFAIAINPAQALIEQLRNGDAPRHALLGVSSRATSDGSDGAAVTAVEPNSGADQAGIEVGDVVVEFDGEAINTPEELVAAIAHRQPGDQADVVVMRDGKKVTLTATLGAHDETPT